MSIYSKSVESSAASIEMEGFLLTTQDKDLCQKLINNEIDMEQYIKIVLDKYGVESWAIL